MATPATILSAVRASEREPLRTAMWLIGTATQFLRVRASKAAIESALAQLSVSTQVYWLESWPSHVVAHGDEACWGEGVVNESAERALAMMGEAVNKARSLSEATAVSLARRANTISAATKWLTDAAAHDPASQATHHAELTAVSSSATDLASSLASTVRAHSQEVAQVASQVSQLMHESSGVERLATACRVATFNARLEAARLGGEGRVFVTIAETLGSLTANVSSQNARTSEISDELARALPSLGRSVEALLAQLEQHAAGLTHRLAQLEKRLLEDRSDPHQRAATAQHLGVIGEQSAGTMADLQLCDRMSQLLNTITSAVDCVRRGEMSSRPLSTVLQTEAALTSPEATSAGGSMELF